jgi:hypothetical protein
MFYAMELNLIWIQLHCIKLKFWLDSYWTQFNSNLIKEKQNTNWCTMYWKYDKTPMNCDYRVD